MQKRGSIRSRVFSLLVFIIFISTCITAQTGTISGVVKDKTNSETIVGANVIIEGTTSGAVTDLDGKYIINNLKPGKYKISISFISYEPFVSGEIIVNASETVNYDVALYATSISLGTVNVVATKKTGNDVSVINSVKGSVSLANGISSQLISKTQDKDAADVVKRIPGITIIDDKFIIVRGLSQRYNTVWLNNASTPSSEADSRAFSFDVVPSSMIDNIMVYKTAQADFPADYTGGFIKITTKAIPDQNDIQFSYSTNYNEGTTFNDFFKYKGSSTDKFGFDNGFRDFPSSMPSNLQAYNSAENPVLQEKSLAIAKEMNKSWVPELKTAMPDQKFLFGISRRFNIGKTTLGNYTVLNYSNSNDYNDILKNNSYKVYDYKLDKIAPLDEFYDHQYTNTLKTSIIHNWAINLNDKNKIEFRNLFNQIGQTRTSIRAGREWYNDGRFSKYEDLYYSSRTMYSGQLGGYHTLKEETTKLDWTLSYSYTNKNEPDNKRYRYVRNETDTTIFTTSFPQNGDLSSFSRNWYALNEKLYSGAINFTKCFVFNEFKPEFKTGLFYEKKDRDFSSRVFSFGSTGQTLRSTSLTPDLIFTDANFNLTDGIKMIENTANSDSYTAGSELYAGYLMAKIPIGVFDLNVGLRVEKDNLFLHSFLTGTTIPANPVRDTINLFPSLNLIYKYNEKSLLRFAYGKTVNRPEFREIAPFYYVDFNLNAGIYGNTGLKQAYINNYDMRYEFYPSPNETFTFGVFYKQLTDAIEFIISGNSPTQYSFTNAKSAYNYGIELEFKKDLEFIGLKNFSATFNGSIIKSNIKAGMSGLCRERPLQGQSPYIINAGLFYQNDKSGIMANLVYNVIGKRIVAVGYQLTNQWDYIPDMYESPRNLLDFTVSKKVGKYVEFKAGIKDIISQDIKYVQTIDTDVDMLNYDGSGIKHFKREQVTKLYNPGRTFSIGISVKI